VALRAPAPTGPALPARRDRGSLVGRSMLGRPNAGIAMNRRKLLKVGASLAAMPLVSRLSIADEAKKTEAPIERVVTKVGTNHGHVFTVGVDDVKAGVEKTYDLTGTSSHGHAVTLTADDFKRLRAGEILRMPSTREGHLHRLLVRTAPAVDPPETANVCEIQIGGKDDHEFAITAAHMAAMAEQSYDIQGVATHTHSVHISGADFGKLVKGEQIAINSSPGAGHAHVVFVRYPGAKKPG
jgi:hypothetical protein